jgi:hypothetical protein
MAAPPSNSAASLELALLSAPPAFSTAATALSALPQVRLAALARRRAAAVLGDGAQPAGEPEGEDAGRAVDLVLRASAPLAASAGAAAAAAAIAGSSDLSRAAAEVLAAEAKGVGAGAHSSAGAPPRPALEGVDWALGVSAASSSSGAALGRPFASLQLRVRRADGSLAVEGVELTLPQLRAFEAQLAEAASALERA